MDYGIELHGGVRIENGITGTKRPVRVRVRFGESVSEVMGTPNNDHAVHDQEVLLPWYGSAEVGNTGFRFVRIDLVDHDAELSIHRVEAVFLYRDLDYRGTFTCSDERLNRIWRTGAYTVHLCMQERLWDGIKRDRLVWIGDMHPETMVISTVFGNHPIVPESLDFVRDQTPLPGWMNGISSYSLWWVLIHHAWYRYHGDHAYLYRQRAYLTGLLRILSGQIDEDGSEALRGHRFLDWPTSEDPAAIHMGLHSLLVLALHRGADLCRILGDVQTAETAEAAQDRLRTHRPEGSRSKQANALTVAAGLQDARDVNSRVLAVNPFFGVSTFYGYYVLQARAAAGDHAGCLELIRRYWGAMLDLGATTFWEDFNLDWVPGSAGISEPVPAGMRDIHGDFGDYCYKGLRHSLCHGWAAGPTAWLSEHVLGVTPLEPGCRVVAIRPVLADLDFAEGTLPTPHGPLRVRHELRRDGTVATDVDAPSGVRVER